MKPPFSITEKTINLIAEIAEQIGKLEGIGEYSRNLHLRKANRFRTIQSSTAIEGNTLTLEQITAVLNGKKVIGNPREIQEVKNAYDAYEKILTFNPYKISDFLKAHNLMTSDLVTESGKFRKGNVGVVAANKVVHVGARPEFVSQLMKDLFAWAKKSDAHPLIKSSVIHFEIEVIHPFADGNGRMGRLWQTLVLASWHEIFAWIPIETIIHKKQQAYYDVLGRAGAVAESTEFVEFMLENIAEAINELPVNKITDIITDISTDKLSKIELEFLKSIANFIKTNGSIDNHHAQLLTNKSEASIKKYFAGLVKAKVLKAIGSNKGRKYSF